MFFTPLDIQNAEFKKSMYGYSDEEVDVFLDKVMHDYQEMRKDIDDLQNKVSILNDGMKQYKNMESSLKETLILAQQTAEEVREEAVKKADNIVKEAELKADEIVQGSRYKLFELNQKIKELHLHALAFKAEYMSKLESELTLLKETNVEMNLEMDIHDKPEKIAMPDIQVKEEALDVVEKVEDDTFSHEIKETLDAVFEEDVVDEIVGTEESDSVAESLEFSEEAVDEILDEILSEEGIQEKEVDKQEAIDFFSADIETNSPGKDENSFKKRLFRRKAIKSDTEMPVVPSNEYKARFIADLDSDDIPGSKRLKREDEKNGEIKKWFLDD